MNHNLREFSIGYFVNKGLADGTINHGESIQDYIDNVAKFSPLKAELISVLSSAAARRKKKKHPIKVGKIDGIFCANPRKYLEVAKKEYLKLEEKESKNNYRTGLLVLKDGSEIQEPMFLVFKLIMSNLITKNPIAFYELVMKARNPGHRFFSDSIWDELLKLNLLEDGGIVRKDFVRLIKLAVTGDGLKMSLNLDIVETPTKLQKRKIESKETLSEQEYFERAQEIKNVVIKFMESCPQISFMESRNSSPNPYYNQTSQGFFLCFSYGNPCSIYTPWGKRDIRGSIGSNGGHIDYSSLLESLGAKVYTKEINNSEGSFGPVYMITKINNKSLPQPVEKTRAEYLSYDDSQNSWETLDKVFLKKQREEMSRVETQNIVDIESLSSILDQYENSSDSLSEGLIRQRDEILEQIVIGQRLSFVPGYSTNKDGSKIQFISISQYPIDERFGSGNSKRLGEINYDTKKGFFSSEIETDNEEIKLVIRYIKICLKKFKSSYASQYTGSKEIVDRKVYVLFDAEKKIDF